MARSTAAPASPASSVAAEALLATVAAVAEVLGGTVVAADDVSDGDVPVAW